MRNPLTAALAAMAIHAGVSLALGWPFPSAPTFLAGTFAIPWAVARPRSQARVMGSVAALALLLPNVVPPSAVLAGVIALLTTFGPRATDPLQNVAIALPALTFLALCFTR